MLSQSVIPSRRSLGGALPYVFTEHGALQLSSVLRSPRATQVGLFIVRAFVRLREILIQDLEVANRPIEIEAKLGKHDRTIRQLVDAAREFIRDKNKIKAQLADRSKPAPTRPKVGFRPGTKD